METKSVKSIIEELGLEDLPEKQKDDLIISLSEGLQIRVTKRLMNILTEEQKNELEKLIANGSEEQADDYLAAKIPNLEIIMEDEYELYRKELLALNDETKEKLAQK